MTYRHIEAPPAATTEGAKINVGLNANWTRNEKYTPQQP